MIVACRTLLSWPIGRPSCSKRAVSSSIAWGKTPGNADLTCSNGLRDIAPQSSNCSAQGDRVRPAQKLPGTRRFSPVGSWLKDATSRAQPSSPSHRGEPPPSSFDRISLAVYAIARSNLPSSPARLRHPRSPGRPMSPCPRCCSVHHQVAAQARGVKIKYPQCKTMIINSM